MKKFTSIRMIYILCLFVFSAVAHATELKVCMVSNVSAWVLHKENETYIAINSTSTSITKNLLHLYKVNIKSKSPKTEKTIFEGYKSDQDNGILLKIADDNTCSISFLLQGKFITFNGFVKNIDSFESN